MASLAPDMAPASQQKPGTLFAIGIPAFDIQHAPHASEDGHTCATLCWFGHTWQGGDFVFGEGQLTLAALPKYLGPGKKTLREDDGLVTRCRRDLELLRIIVKAKLFTALLASHPRLP